jgi:NADH-quinone oxidoreductase subunit F
MSLTAATPKVCSWTMDHDDPASLATYVAHGGYQALRRVLTENISGDDIIAQLKLSALRGLSDRAEMELHAARVCRRQIHRLQQR